jgi:hypothetical protein
MGVEGLALVVVEDCSEVCLGIRNNKLSEEWNANELRDQDLGIAVRLCSVVGGYVLPKKKPPKDRRIGNWFGPSKESVSSNTTGFQSIRSRFYRLHGLQGIGKLITDQLPIPAL